jgi:hypothetical protein
LLEVDANHYWDMVSAVVQIAGTVVALLAAIAAWWAALASKRAVDEMAAARHQYVRPVLVFREPSNIEVDLGTWTKRPGAGHPLFDAQIEIQNVGKGPAFGVEFTWNFKGETRTSKSPINVSAINEFLAESELRLSEDDRSWQLGILNSNQFFWKIMKSNFHHSRKFDKIEEGETVSVKIPDELIGLQILHSLNHFATETKSGDGKWAYYAQPEYWRDVERDIIEIHFRSITDSLHFMELEATPRGGVYGYHDVRPFFSALKVSLAVIKTVSGKDVPTKPVRIFQP